MPPREAAGAYAREIISGKNRMIMRTNIYFRLIMMFFTAALAVSCAVNKTGIPDEEQADIPDAAAAATLSASDAFDKAVMLAHRRHYDAAVAIYNGLIARKEKVTESYENLARLYLDQQEFIFSAHLNRDQPTMDYDNALEMCEAALKINPASAKALAVRGEIRLDQSDLKGAIEDLKRADEIDSSVHVKFLLSAAYGNLGDAEASEKYQEEAKKENTGDYLRHVHK